MLFDTDILIWVQRGSQKASELIDDATQRAISTQTYLELLQGAHSKKQHLLIRTFLKDFSFEMMPFTENIGHRASIYVEDYALSHGVRAGDAIIAATAMEYNLPLATGNAKHFQCVPGLQLKVFKP